MVAAVLSFLPAAALLVVAPGPDSLLVLRNSARGGRAAGLATAAGTVTGLVAWAAAAALGLAALLRASELGYTAVRWAGAGYLVFLGGRLAWRSRRGTGPAGQASTSQGGTSQGGTSQGGTSQGGTSQGGTSQARAERAPAPGSWLAGYLTGAGTNLLNPKVGVFFISILPVFIPRGAPPAPTALALGGAYVAEGIAWLALLVLLGGRLAAALTQPRVRRRLEGVTGLVMIGFGVRLALERR
jgi:threonine/homoserine/homoserine lactone efflux protein